MTGDPGSIKATAQCGACGHFASVHHGGGGGRPGGSSCAAPDCQCTNFLEPSDALVQLGVGNLTAAEVAQLTGLSVHTLSYWRQSGQGPKTIKAGNRTLYRRTDVERWLADVDGRAAAPRGAGSANWFLKAVEAAERIDPVHTAPWKLASTYALLSIAEAFVSHPTRTTCPLTRTEMVKDDGEFLTVAEVAAMTRLSVGTLRYWRHRGSGGPPSVKLGRRVLYRRADVETWLTEAR